MVNPPFKSDLFYSVQNEDYQTELAVLDRIYRDAPLRVLMVASSGENACTATGRSMISEVMGQYLFIDQAFNARLPHIERGPWFRTTAAGFRN